MLIRQIALATLFSSALLGQTAANSSGNGSQNSQPGPHPFAELPQQPPEGRPADGDLAQMRVDLDRMESLNNNMSSEIEFLRDQNLQILLRTNAQMWTILIRDLRRRIDADQRHLNQPPASGPNSSPQPVPR